MTFRLHHAFVCTSVAAPEAEELREAGLVEGSSNIHPGQGTANRRFFFQSGFLELLWVHDEREARSPLAGPTRLWERWVGRAHGSHPFGLCFSSADANLPALPCRTWSYRPDYLSDGRAFLFADDMPLAEPEIFIPNWPLGSASPTTEPTVHPLGLAELQSVSIGLPDAASISRSLRAMREAGLVMIHPSERPALVLTFSSHQEVRRHFPALGITLVGVGAEGRH